MRFVQGYDAAIGALGWFVVANAVLTFFGIPLGLAGFAVLARLEPVWLHASIALSGSLFVLSVFDGRLQRSVQVYNDRFRAEGRRPGFSDMFPRTVGGSAIAAAMSLLLWGEIFVLAVAQRFHPAGLHAFAAFFGASLVAMQAFKYDPDVRRRIIATFPYDPGDAPVPPSLRAVVVAAGLIASLVIAASWLAVNVWHLNL